MSSGKRAPGMKLRRPGNRVPSEAEVRRLEAQAEKLASKAPGAAVLGAKSPAPAAGSALPKPVEEGGGDRQKAGRHKPAKGKGASRKVQITAYLPRELRDRLSRAAVALSGPPSHESVTSIVERAIRRELGRLEKKHGEFPETGLSPKPGRRAGGH